jgi:hypothetical protein
MRPTTRNTVRAVWLADLMTTHRERTGVAFQDAAAFLRIPPATLLRHESGHWPFPPRLVHPLLDLYRVTDEHTRTDLTTLSRNTWRTNHSTTDPNPIPYPPLTWLWERAERADVWGPVTMPTPDRTRAVNRVAGTTGYPGRPMTVVIDHTVLDRPVGGDTVLRDRLLALDLDPDITVRVLPTGLDAHPGCHGPYTVLTMPDLVDPVVVVEHLGGHLFLEGEPAGRYRSNHHALTTTALGVAESGEVLRTWTGS